MGRWPAGVRRAASRASGCSRAACATLLDRPCMLGRSLRLLDRWKDGTATAVPSSHYFVAVPVPAPLVVLLLVPAPVAPPGGPPPCGGSSRTLSLLICESLST